MIAALKNIRHSDLKLKNPAQLAGLSGEVGCHMRGMATCRRIGRTRDQLLSTRGSY